jgi:hypothetical protein
LLELREQSSRTPQGIRVARHALGTSILPLRYQPGTLQHGDVLLHGGERHVVVRGEFAHGRVGVHDPRQDVATRGIGERSKQPIQSVRRRVPIYNHLVVYRSMARWHPGWSNAIQDLIRTDCRSPPEVFRVRSSASGGSPAAVESRLDHQVDFIRSCELFAVIATLIGDTLTQCDPFGIPSTSHWTGVAIIGR